MALGDLYGTVEDLKEQFKITDAADDDELERALRAASRAVERYCGRQFNQATTASERRYAAVTSELLLVDDVSVTDGLVVDGVAFDADTHELEPENGVVDGEPGWPYWRIRGSGFEGRVAVTARWGWPAVPAPIVEAVLMTAVEVWRMKDAPFGVAGTDEFGVIRVRENRRVSAMLDPYRRHAAMVA